MFGNYGKNTQLSNGAQVELNSTNPSFFLQGQALKLFRFRKMKGLNRAPSTQQALLFSALCVDYHMTLA